MITEYRLLNVWNILIILPTVFYLASAVLSLLEDAYHIHPKMITYSFYAYVILSLISPLAIYFDRKNIPSEASWTPSDIYYLSGIPIGLNMILQIMYVYKRNKIDQ